MVYERTREQIIVFSKPFRVKTEHDNVRSDLVWRKWRDRTLEDTRQFYVTTGHAWKSGKCSEEQTGNKCIGELWNEEV